MKIFLIILMVFTLTVSSNAGWFDNDSQREQQLEQQVQQEQHTNGDLSGIIVVLGISGVILLVVGTAIGSKVRRDHESTH
jgi:hypothetical protein